MWNKSQWETEHWVYINDLSALCIKLFFLSLFLELFLSYLTLSSIEVDNFIICFCFNDFNVFPVNIHTFLLSYLDQNANMFRENEQYKAELMNLKQQLQQQQVGSALSINLCVIFYALLFVFFFMFNNLAWNIMPT